jgi:hypothetical protein
VRALAGREGTAAAGENLEHPIIVRRCGGLTKLG